MNEAGEKALVALLYSALSGTVSDRITWDDEEIDIPYPAVILRLISSGEQGRDMSSRGNSRRSLVEMSAFALTSTGASQLMDQALAALAFCEAGPFEIAVGTDLVRFGAILLDSVQQSPSARERSYRKSALLMVWQYL